MATDPAKKSPDPDLDPADGRQATDLTKIQPMSDQLQNPLPVSRRRPTFWVWAVVRPELFRRRSIGTSRAHLLDQNNEGV